MTPDEVVASVLEAVGEKDGIFHTEEQVMRHVQYAEQLLGMLRGLTEKTGPLALTYAQPLYRIHNVFPDFIYPLSASIGKKQLLRGTLRSIVDRDPRWLQTFGTPKFFFMVSATQFGIYPLAPSTGLSLSVTYVAVPPVPTENESYLIDRQWHDAMITYASAILLAKEAKYQQATTELNAFMEMAGLKRDGRFGPREARGKTTDTPNHQATENTVG